MPSNSDNIDNQEAVKLAKGLTDPQKHALTLAADGWPLSFYIPHGAVPGDRRGSFGSPYWSMRKGRETPKPPHWRVATSLQDLGLIEHGDDAMPITPLGLAVHALLPETSHVG